MVVITDGGDTVSKTNYQERVLPSLSSLFY